ncbi:hypothetical protein A2154_00050 [Candidatus Gottesmanbacteria bacterium RBG_16_43_7]|uniref:Acetyltransferase n=1 Tax=Candidatus Gottesmanbacteria bacterium RBG_16_43_7 TaxID=1798373 RepID=A0A1F5ZB78_9BACT|nr:MAG: hypothetical protein A2154_00050 [Candidatus Gottesmanbacteria bacterium RBG_16_43_7]
MKALGQIGIRKAFAFVFYSLVAKILHWIILPQIRVLIIKTLGARIGKNTIIGNASFANLYHYGFRKLATGDKCFIGDEAMMDVRGGIILEDDVTISNRVNVISHINVGYDDHPLQAQYPTTEKKVVIKKGAYIGTAATILPGVTIGRMAVVGAGAVVTRNVAARTVVAGVPAHRIRRLK